MSDNNCRNPIIDIAKYAAALMIVAIHTTGSFGTENNAGFFVMNVLCRLAVPFFAVCSGYFLTSIAKESGRLNVIFRQMKKLAILYTEWSAVYLLFSIPKWIKTGWFSAAAFVDYAVAAVRSGSYYHFWYLLALIYALPIFWLCIKYVNRRLYPLIASVLWCEKAITYCYGSFLPQSVNKLMPNFGKLSALDSAIFCILPLMLIGAFIQGQKKNSLLFNIVGASISFLLLCVEAFILKSNGKEAVSYILLTLPTAYFVFSLLNGFKIQSKSKLPALAGKASMLIYCIHPMMGELISSVTQSRSICFLFAAVGSTVISVLLLKVRTALIKNVQAIDFGNKKNK